MSDEPVSRKEFDELRAEVRINTELTKDIHAMIRGFKIFMLIAKWVGVVAGAAVALKTGWNTFSK